MLQTTENAAGNEGQRDVETPDRVTEIRGVNGLRIIAEHDRWRSALPLTPLSREAKQPEDTGPLLAAFCFEDPEGAVGTFVANLAKALARRGASVHIFSRKDFNLDDAGIGCHAMGECEGDDLVTQVQDFAGRACTAFLKLFPVGSVPVTLMAFEWSAMPAVSLVRGLKNLDTIVALNSLERQRGDLKSELSQAIDEIERVGLRDAKAVLVVDAAAAEAAKTTAPECADRIALFRERFPAHLFETKLDPGAIKARHQVGPVDPMILFVGDLDERYGPDLLIKAMPAILKNHGQARLVIVGDGQLQWPLRVYTRYLLLEHAVRIVGDVRDQALRELIAAADVVVVPSRDSTPWWPIQAAWAARRPLVLTHPAAPGLVVHEQEGVLVFPSENSLVWGIERVLYDSGLREKLAENGAKKLWDEFGWGAAAAQVAEVMNVPASAKR